MMKFSPLILAAGMVMSTISSHAADIITKQALAGGGQGSVNWSDGFFEVTGRATANPSGNPVAMRLQSVNAARTMAYTRLGELVSGVKVTSGTTVKDMVFAGQLAASKITSTVNGAVTVSEEITWFDMENGGKVPEAAVTLRLCMRNSSPACMRYGDAAQGMLASSGVAEAAKAAAEAAPEPEAKPEPAPAPAAGKADNGADIMSLIITTKGLNFQPTLTIDIVTDDGQVVYSMAKIDQAALFENGPAQFASDVDSAKTMDLIKAEPIVIAAVKIGSDGQLIISKDQAAKLLSANLLNGDFLKGARVAVIF